MLRNFFQRAIHLPIKQYSIGKSIKKYFSEEGQRIRDFMNNIENEKEEDDQGEDKTISLGEDEETKVKSGKTAFSKSQRIQYHPKDILNLLKENYYENPNYINMTMHLTVDYVKKDQKVKGVYVPYKKLDINNVICVVTNERNRQIVESSNAIFADETIIQQIKSEQVTFNKIIFTTDSLSRMDKFLKNLLAKNNQLPDKDLATLCTDEDLAKTLNDFNDGMIEFYLNNSNFIECGVGMTNFTNKEVLYNIDRFVKAINDKKPKSHRAMRYFKRAFLSVAGGKYHEILLPIVTPSSFDYFMNDKIDFEEHVVTIENVTKTSGYKSDEDEFNLKI